MIHPKGDVVFPELLTPKSGNAPVKRCEKFIIDCDAGGDDAHGIMIALHMAKKFNIEIIGITCVVGNTSLDSVALNVEITKKICGVENIPIYKGCTKSILLKDYRDNFYEEDGLGG
jgi:purine nucleosidase